MAVYPKVLKPIRFPTPIILWCTNESNKHFTLHTNIFEAQSTNINIKHKGFIIIISGKYVVKPLNINITIIPNRRQRYEKWGKQKTEPSEWPCLKVTINSTSKFSRMLSRSFLGWRWSSSCLTLMTSHPFCITRVGRPWMGVGLPVARYVECPRVQINLFELHPWSDM